MADEQEECLMHRPSGVRDAHGNWVRPHQDLDQWPFKCLRCGRAILPSTGTANVFGCTSCDPRPSEVRILEHLRGASKTPLTE